MATKMGIKTSIKWIEFGSLNYDKMLDLRRKVLRIPLGLDFNEEDINKDKKSKLIGYYNPNNELLGCCVVDIEQNISSITVRQMAVLPLHQNAGIGRSLMLFVEEFAKEVKINKISLHARKVAVDFYLKLGYFVCSDEYLEVTIPHFSMEKEINLNE